MEMFKDSQGFLWETEEERDWANTQWTQIMKSLDNTIASYERANNNLAITCRFVEAATLLLLVAVGLSLVFHFLSR